MDLPSLIVVVLFLAPAGALAELWNQKQTAERLDAGSRERWGRLSRVERFRLIRHVARGNAPSDERLLAVAADVARAERDKEARWAWVVRIAAVAAAAGGGVVLIATGVPGAGIALLLLAGLGALQFPLARRRRARLEAAERRSRELALPAS